MPRKKIKEMTQVHGKVETPQYSTLDQIWGDTGLSRYKTLKVEEYQQYLAEMPKTDLHAHAVNIGIIPVDDREVLVKRLIKEFNRHVGGFQKPMAVTGKSAKPVQKKVLDILSEGR